MEGRSRPPRPRLRDIGTKRFSTHIFHPQASRCSARPEYSPSSSSEARNEVKWEMYTKKLQIEARVLGDLAINHVIPVAIRYQSVLTDNVRFKLKTLFPNEKGDKPRRNGSRHHRTHINPHGHNHGRGEKMVNARKAANKIDDEREKPSHTTIMCSPAWMSSAITSTSSS